jgi:hypothetical protein
MMLSEHFIICRRCQCKTSCLVHVWKLESGQWERELVCLACRRMFRGGGAMKESE